MAEQIKEREEMMSNRLTRLIDGFVFGSQIAVNSIEWNSAKVKELADYLIANGVIVPPCKDEIIEIKSEAVKEFAEKLKEIVKFTDDTYECWEIEGYIDNLVKELVGEKNE